MADVVKLIPLCLAWLGLWMSTPAAGAPPDLRELPPILRAVSGEVGVLSLAEGRDLSRIIDDIERKTRVKVIVLIAETTQPESIEAYVQRLVNRWRRQTEALNSGRFIFVVVAKDDRALRVVPGEKLSSILKPFQASRATAAALALLKQNKYFEALDIIVDKLAQLIADHGDVVLPEREIPQKEKRFKHASRRSLQG